MIHVENEKLREMISLVRRPDDAAAALAVKKWNSIAKPIHGMGKAEDMIVKIAGMTGSARVDLDKKLLIVMCADNGVVEEGVSQSGQDVTALVADNFASGDTTACHIAKMVHADVWPVDIGVAADTKIENRKIARGTKNMAKGPAMTRGEAESAILAGIDKVREAADAGYRIIATGEMGIGNTSTSSAIISVLMSVPPEDVTGRGAGMDSATLNHKVEVIRRAIAVNRPDPADAADVLAKVGGFDIAGLAGVFLGGAVYRIPVVIDGLISSVAALIAARLCPDCVSYMLASHVSKEPAARMVLDELGLDPVLTADMHLGEGTGALMLYPVLDIALEIYYHMLSFGDIELEAYVDYSETEGRM